MNKVEKFIDQLKRELYSKFNIKEGELSDWGKGKIDGEIGLYTRIIEELETWEVDMKDDRFRGRRVNEKLVKSKEQEDI